MPTARTDSTARSRTDSSSRSRTDSSSRSRGLDAIDRALIAHLQTDGRASYAALAKLVGLSEAAARQRVQRLLASGVMQIVAVTDPLTVNLARQAMVGIRVDGDTREVARHLAEIEEVDYVVLSAGTFDVLCEITCQDDDQLIELLNTHIRTIPGIRGTETFVYLKLVKQTYAWGQPPE
ncbi:Lrp/AsnC family transcriptional regulator for asnA, asnC and gidA [Motilibacter rhizosphaerae]|uniref:Lrp/AsnC family transcriptional regulator for asnA, asnC and gidA n=1 Tax=Motilibacter rhizosphaerae TaxID=598652 RepID=A0A4Q7NSC3_9ACTN|nr:Lrp/AsnC family transcriptional regulator [Motilibacter rhizosphaerae]RZS89991.1 Lrp/AsnC family transcriptional regulator for asnA, asnC and gidA [Motilibacter rhizosphaerae]